MYQVISVVYNRIIAVISDAAWKIKIEIIPLRHVQIFTDNKRPLQYTRWFEIRLQDFFDKFIEELISSRTKNKK